MRKIIASVITVFLTAILSTTGFIAPAQAAVSPLSLGIVPPVQFPPDDFAITGARISGLWGRHRDVYGLDLGLLGNITDQNFVGVGLAGIFNVTRGAATVVGLQFAGATNLNYNKTKIYGIQAAVGMNYQEQSSSVVGLQIALLGNIAAFTDIYGAQVGIFNRALDVYGFQIGLVNVASSLHGIQIGLVNFNAKGPFSVSPFLNVGF